jgi:hypothetical protein
LIPAPTTGIVNGDGTVYSAKDGAAVYLGSMMLAGIVPDFTQARIGYRRRVP